MQGIHTFDPHAETVIVLESFVAEDHVLCKIDGLLDMALVREVAFLCYASGLGQPSIDPEDIFRMELLAFLFSTASSRSGVSVKRSNFNHKKCD